MPEQRDKVCLWSSQSISTQYYVGFNQTSEKSKIKFMFVDIQKKITVLWSYKETTDNKSFSVQKHDKVVYSSQFGLQRDSPRINITSVELGGWTSLASWTRSDISRPSTHYSVCPWNSTMSSFDCQNKTIIIFFFIPLVVPIRWNTVNYKEIS